MGMLLFWIALLGAVATSGLVAAALRLPSFSAYLAAVYVLVAAEIVGLTLVLSLWHGVTESGYIVGEALLLAAALAFWRARGRTRPPARPGLSSYRDPLSLFLVVVLGLAVAYIVVLVVATPPNNWDSLWYHLSRAALWHQHHGVRYIEPVSSELVNAYPPNAEIGVLYTFTFLSRDTVAAGVQLFALVGSMVAVYGLARRLGFAGRAALLAAFVFASLPLVALQAGTTQNDLVTASFIAIAAFFSFGKTRIELVLAGLAVGLAVGTKFTALLAVPALVLVVVAAQPLRRVPAAFAAWIPGVMLLGSYGYIQNLVEKGHLLGLHAGLAEVATGGSSSPGLETRAATVGRLLYRFFDLSGLEAIGQRGYAVLILAVLFVGAILVEARSPSRRARLATLAVGLLALSPLLLPPLAELAGHAYQGAVRAAGRPEWAYSRWYGLSYGIVQAINERANEDWGYFGPLGALLLVPVAVARPIAWLRGRADNASTALALALPVFICVVALTTPWDNWRGRFLIIPLALLAPLTAALHRWSFAAWGVAVVGAAMLFLNLFGNEQKPSGIPGVGYTGQSYLPVDKGFSVWGAPRAVVQSISRPAMRPVLTAVDKIVPDDAAVGLALDGGAWSYPFFGATLSRRVSFLVSPVRLDRIPADGPDWVIAAPDELSTVCAANWRPRPIGDSGWTILSREPGADSCVVPKSS